MSRMTVRATAREMLTIPHVETTFTGWANGKYILLEMMRIIIYYKF